MSSQCCRLAKSPIRWWNIPLVLSPATKRDEVMGWVRLQWGGAEPAATPPVNIRWNPQNQRLQHYLHMSTNKTTFVFWNTKQKLEKKQNKNTRLHTIFITSCPGTRRAFIFLSKLHNLSHRGYSHPQHTSLRPQKWKCCRSQNYSKTGTLKKQTKHFLFTTRASQREIAPSWYNLSRRGTSSNMSGLPIPAVMWVVVEVLGVFPSRSPSHFPHTQSQAGTAYVSANLSKSLFF